MKNLTIICLFLLSKLLFTQTVLVPYKVGNKFGLSDEKGKLIVKPEYDGIEYLHNKYIENGHYFKYTNVSLKTDTIIRYNSKKKEAEEKKVYSYGLFNQSKLLIKDQVCSDFLIYPYLIIASTNPHNAERCALYNLKGKQLITEPIISMYVNDKRDLGYLSVLSKKHTLLSIMQKNEDNRRVLSLAVYDNDKQEITQWLLNNVLSFKVEENQKAPTVTGCKYQDKDGIHEKYMRFKNNKFEIVTQTELTQSEKESLFKRKTELYGSGSSSGNGGRQDRGILSKNYSDNDVAVPNDIMIEGKEIETYPETEAEKHRYTFYTKAKENDTLFFNEPNTRELFSSKPIKTSPILIPKELEIIYVDKVSSNQFLQLIYKKENKYGIVNRGVFNEVLYDSVLYFGSDFIVGIKKENTYHFGIIKANGTKILPILYDSICSGIKQAEYLDPDRNYYELYQRKFTLKNKKDDSNSSKTFCAYWKKRETANTFYKDGKAGILDYNTNEVLMPAEYDFIAENVMNYTGFKKSKFYILKKNNKYGVTTIEYNYTLKKLEVKNTIQPLFNYIPCYYIDNYYNVKYFKLFALLDENGKGIGYANESGLEYFKNNN